MKIYTKNCMNNSINKYFALSFASAGATGFPRWPWWGWRAWCSCKYYYISQNASVQSLTSDTVRDSMKAVLTNNESVTGTNGTSWTTWTFWKIWKWCKHWCFILRLKHKTHTTTWLNRIMIKSDTAAWLYFAALLFFSELKLAALYTTRTSRGHHLLLIFTHAHLSGLDGQLQWSPVKRFNSFFLLPGGGWQTWKIWWAWTCRPSGEDIIVTKNTQVKVTSRVLMFCGWNPGSSWIPWNSWTSWNQRTQSECFSRMTLPYWSFFHLVRVLTRSVMFPVRVTPVWMERRERMVLQEPR